MNSPTTTSNNNNNNSSRRSVRSIFFLSKSSNNKKIIKDTIRRKFSFASGGHDCNTPRQDDDSSLIPVEVGIQAVPLAEDRLTEILSKSRFVKRRNRLFDVPSFSKDAFDVGQLVAHGGFCNVHMLQRWNCDCELNEDDNIGKLYVIKSLRAKVAGRSPEILAMNAADLLMEAHMLSALSRHPHILPLRGISTKGLVSLKKGRVDGLFLMLDYLPQTLHHKLVEWQDENDNDPSSPSSSLADRLQAAVQLASALEYVHKKNIIYRDLKPSNVGFDSKGHLYLFDFGLAVEVPRSSDPNKLYKLAAKKGTPRYMAPEVINKRYNCKADVFSYSILLWQVLVLEKPLSSATANETVTSRIVSGDRPSLKKLNNLSLPETSIASLQHLLHQGWSKHPEERPTMRDIRKQLEGIQKGHKQLQTTNKLSGMENNSDRSGDTNDSSSSTRESKNSQQQHHS